MDGIKVPYGTRVSDQTKCHFLSPSCRRFDAYLPLPRHELAGVVTKVGPNVTSYKVGDHVGVGCMVGSCHSCDACEKHLEQYCPKCVFTYNTPLEDGTLTYGGYSNRMVCDEQ